MKIAQWIERAARRSVIADYLVSSLSGNDSGDGKSVPFLTFGPLSAMAPGALSNKAVAIERGSVLTSRLVATATNAKVIDYGSGADPQLEIRDIIPAGSWTVHGTYANCYNTTVALPNDPKMQGNVWADAFMILQVTAQATCGATLNTCWVSSWTGATATVMINSATDPRVDGRTYRYSARTDGMLLNGNGNSTRNIGCIGNGHQDGGIRLVGENTVVEGGVMRDGNRHTLYTGANTVRRRVTFIRGRNDLEGGGFANGDVANQTSITGKTLTTEDCTWDGSDGGPFTGSYGHGSVATDMFATVTHTNGTYRNLMTAHAICGATTLILGGTFGPNVQTLASFSTLGAGGEVRSCTGSVYRALDAGTGGTMLFKNNTFTCPGLKDGFYRSTTTAADMVLTVDGDVVTITSHDVFANPTYLMNLPRGTGTIKNATIGPALGCPVGVVAVVGGTGQTFVSQNNIYPIGANFTVNGVTYNTLGDLQTAGLDTGSVEGAAPAATFTDNFARADGNLDGSAGYTVTGTANQIGIRSGAAATIGTNQTLYAIETGSAIHFMGGKVAGVPGTAGPVFITRAADATNWSGLRWGSTGYQFQACINGTFTTDSVIAGITPSATDLVYTFARGTVDYAYWKPTTAATFRRLFRRDLSTISGAVAAIGSATKVGLLARGSLQNPWVDDISSGPST